MQAIAVRRGESTPVVVDRPRPEPGPGEALVRTLRVGVDGTDHEVLAGGHGSVPDGEDLLVLGHEAVGVVADPNGTDLREGEVVVPTVRRPPAGGSDYFDRGEPDMAPPGEYRERGIDGAHGFMAAFFTSPAEYLVSLPASLADHGFLLEPLSVAAKALELAEASRSTFAWDTEVAVVLGNGSLGLLTLAVLGDECDRTYCVGRRDRPDPTVDLIESLGATYVDSRETPVAAFPDAHEAADLVVEATGHPPHALESVHALAPNGVLALLGVPADATLELDAGAYHRSMVLGNRAVVGSVNSAVRHFETAAEWLADLSDGFVDDLVTGVYGLGEFERAFAADDTTIKTAVEFGTHEERR
ncbi:MAG: glucose 1-dehydrogenase [Haloferacaceae archaeon]